MKRNLDDSSSQHQKRKRSNNLSSKNVKSLLNIAQTADVSSKCILNIVVIDAKLGDCR
jgi:hypothetical protein